MHTGHVTQTSLMESEERVYQVAMTLIPGIGAITAKKLIAYIGSPEGVFREKPSGLRSIPGIGDYLASKVSSRDFVGEARAEVEAMVKSKISAAYYLDKSYPERLRNCEDGPLLLYYRGNPVFNRSKYLSIVGTRNASAYGRQMTGEVVDYLAQRYPDLVIISGLAYGIDITAHRSALEAGLDTFSVLAHGMKTIYPSAHVETAARILKQGGLLTDFHSKVKPERNNFLRRNRIIAGLADATLIIESAAKGGALITAELASSYNRDVFAIPGRATDSWSEGCNQLIRNNLAALVCKGEDIEKMMGWETALGREEDKRQLLTVPLTEQEESILRHLEEEPGIGREILAVRTSIPVHLLSGILLQMELRNWIKVLPGNHYEARVST